MPPRLFLYILNFCHILAGKILQILQFVIFRLTSGMREHINSDKTLVKGKESKKNYV